MYGWMAYLYMSGYIVYTLCRLWQKNNVTARDEDGYSRFKRVTQEVADRAYLKVLNGYVT